MTGSQPDGGLLGLLPLIFIIGIPLLIILSWRKRIKSATNLPTVEQYLEKHPDTKKKNGIACNLCGSTNIYLWWVYGPEVGRGPKKHICRTCGKELWHST